MIKLSKLILLLGITCWNTAQGQLQGQVQELPFIEVQGIAELEVVPDEIFVDISLRERYDKKEKTSVEEQEAQLIGLLESLHVEVKNVSLTTANAAYVNVKKVGKDVIARKDYRVKLNDALTVGRLFEQLDKLDMDDAVVSKMGHSGMDSLKRVVNIRAMKVAKDKSDYLLAAMGLKSGRAIIVREQPLDVLQAATANSRDRLDLNDSGYKYNDGFKVIVPKKNIQLQLISVRASLYAKFLIKE